MQLEQLTIKTMDATHLVSQLLKAFAMVILFFALQQMQSKMHHLMRDYSIK